MSWIKHHQCYGSSPAALCQYCALLIPRRRETARTWMIQLTDKSFQMCCCRCCCWEYNRYRSVLLHRALWALPGSDHEFRYGAGVHREHLKHCCLRRCRHGRQLRSSRRHQHEGFWDPSCRIVASSIDPTLVMPV